MQCGFIHGKAKRELAIIKAWLMLPAWKRLLSVPNLNKPVP